MAAPPGCRACTICTATLKGDLLSATLLMWNSRGTEENQVELNVVVWAIPATSQYLRDAAYSWRTAGNAQITSKRAEQRCNHSHAPQRSKDYIYIIWFLSMIVHLIRQGQNSAPGLDIRPSWSSHFSTCQDRHWIQGDKSLLSSTSTIPFCSFFPRNWLSGLPTTWLRSCISLPIKTSPFPQPSIYANLLRDSSCLTRVESIFTPLRQLNLSQICIAGLCALSASPSISKSTDFVEETSRYGFIDVALPTLQDPCLCWDFNKASLLYISFLYVHYIIQKYKVCWHLQCQMARLRWWRLQLRDMPQSQSIIECWTSPGLRFLIYQKQMTMWWIWLCVSWFHAVFICLLSTDCAEMDYFDGLK